MTFFEFQLRTPSKFEYRTTENTKTPFEKKKPLCPKNILKKKILCLKTLLKKTLCPKTSFK